MTDNLLIGPKPEGPLYPTPWQASNWGNLVDANGNTLYFAAGGVPLEDSKKLGPAVADAVNVHCGRLGGAADVLDAKDARIADLEDRLRIVRGQRDGAESRAKAVEKRAEHLLSSLTIANENTNGFRKRAEKAEARVRDLEFQLEGATESLEEARSAYLQLSKERMEESVSDLVSRMAIPSHSIPVDTFTAPDGRVFRVGQRVYGALSKAHLGEVTGWDTESGTVYFTGGVQSRPV